VLDIDPRHGGDTWLASQNLPETRVHTTRSGGLHYFFKHRPGLGCSRDLIARGVDVRSEGGYVIWWPLAGCKVLSEGPIADWPATLIEALQKASELPTTNKNASLMTGWRPSTNSDVPKPFYLRVCELMPNSRGVNRRRVIELLRGLVEKREGRNTALFNKAATFRKANGPISDGIITYEPAADLLLLAAQINGYVAQDGEDETKGTIRSGLGLKIIRDAFLFDEDSQHWLWWDRGRRYGIVKDEAL
jgi:hypothetical protein